MSTPPPLKAKLFLIGFGLCLGILGIELALRILAQAKQGSEFDSIEDLQRTMLQAPEASSNADGSGVSLREIIHPHPNPRIIFDLRPNLEVRFQRAAVRTNSCGMRGAELSIVKAPGTYRIALLGDSFAFGWGVEESEGTAAVLERTLESVRGRLPSPRVTNIEVLNFGVPGYSTFQQVELYTERVMDFSPDAVVVFFVENDFGPPFFMRDFGVGDGGGLMSSVSFLRLARQAADPRFQEHNLELQGLDPNRSLRTLSDLTRRDGVRLVLFPNPKKRWDQDRQRLPVLRERRDILVADVRNHFNALLKTRGIKKEELTLSFDPHPSPKKHELMGELLAVYFLGAL